MRCDDLPQKRAEVPALTNGRQFPVFVACK